MYFRTEISIFQIQIPISLFMIQIPVIELKIFLITMLSNEKLRFLSEIEIDITAGGHK